MATGSNDKVRGAVNPLRVAVWGIGAHAVKTVLPELFKCMDLRIAGIYSRSDQVCAEQSAIYACRVWQTVDEMLTSNDVDVVYLVTPTALHFEQGQAVLKAGKHLWCEKPLSTSQTDARELVSLARSRSLCLGVVCGPRYHAHFRAVKAQLDGANIGNVRQINAKFQFPHLEPTNFRYRSDLGGGALLDIGFYLFYLADALVDGEIIQMSSELASDDGYQVDTHGHATLMYKGDVTVELFWGFGGDYSNYLSVEGDKGTLLAEPFFSKPKNRPPSLIVTDLRGIERPIEMPNESPFEGMLKIFCEGVRIEGQREDLWREALSSQELLHQAHQRSLDHKRG